MTKKRHGDRSTPAAKRVYEDSVLFSKMMRSRKKLLTLLVKLGVKSAVRYAPQPMVMWGRI